MWHKKYKFWRIWQLYLKVKKTINPIYKLELMQKFHANDFFSGVFV